MTLMSNGKRFEEYMNTLKISDRRVWQIIDREIVFQTNMEDTRGTSGVTVETVTQSLVNDLENVLKDFGRVIWKMQGERIEETA